MFDWDGTSLLKPGEYARHPNGEWFACTANDMLANLSRHGVVEHEDGSITVTPSILVRTSRPEARIDVVQDRPDGRREWHGYIERGVWRTA